MYEIEQEVNFLFYFIRTEGMIDIEWLRRVLGYDLLTDGQGEARVGDIYPCGSSCKFTSYRRQDAEIICIHTDRVCTVSLSFILSIQSALVNRPDLVNIEGGL